MKSKDTRLLNRREFGGLCVALSSFVTSSGASALDAAAGAGPAGAGRIVKFRDGTVVPALGQGSWHLAQGRHPAAEEEEALRTGLALGMTLIDTAEIYSNGHSEELIGRVIAGQRDHVFLVSKVLPSHVTGDGMGRACAASLARLGTDHLDLYLLHWRNGITDLSGVVTSFENLRVAGKIRAWGVSNFTVRDMEDLFHVLAFCGRTTVRPRDAPIHWCTTGRPQRNFYAFAGGRVKGNRRCEHKVRCRAEASGHQPRLSDQSDGIIEHFNCLYVANAEV